MPVFIIRHVFLLISILSLNARKMIVDEYVMPCTMLAKACGKNSAAIDSRCQNQTLYHTRMIGKHG